MNFHININIIREILLIISLSLYFLRAIYGDLFFLLMGSLFGNFILFIGLCKQEKAPVYSYLLTIILIAGSFNSLFNNSFSSWSLFIFLMLGSFGVSWEIYKKGLNIYFIQTLFYVSCFLFIFLFFLNNYSPEGILAHSRNHVSVYFINLLTLLFIAYHVNNSIYFCKWQYLIPASFVLLICILAIGLSGIVSSSILLFIVICHFFRKIILYLLFLMLTLLIILYIYLFLIPSDNFVFEINNHLLNSKFLTDPRIIIWSEYIYSLNLSRTLTGTSFSEIFGGYNNIHNSFLLLHQRIGVISIFVFFLFFISLIKLIFIDILLFACLLSLFARGLSDTIFLAASPFDFILFYLIFFCPFIKIYHHKVKYD